MTDFRSVGFTDAAASYPRSKLALAMFAAFNGVTPEQLPEAMRYFPNEATERAWTRVAEPCAADIYERPDEEPFPQPSRKDGGEPCGECGIQPGETCDICGAAALSASGSDQL